MRKTTVYIITDNYKQLLHDITQIFFFYFLPHKMADFQTKSATMWDKNGYNKVAPDYLHKVFQMTDINLDNALSNLRSVESCSVILIILTYCI